ncbi:MAG: hypothetical protein ACE5GL_02070, partial [Calditrichia bacterium]
DISSNGFLAFSSKSGHNDALYIYDLKKRKIVRKYQWDDIVGISSPSFSADGQSVVFSGLGFNGRRDLYYLRSFDEKLIQLTNDIYDDKAPTFSPDGKNIVFSSDRTTFGEDWCYNLFVLNLDTYMIYYVTSGKFKDNSPVWSPDGKYIAFTSDRDTSLNIWVADVSKIETWGANSYRDIPVKRITRFANAAFDPEWMGDDALLFSVYEENSFQIRALPKVKERFLESKDLEKNTTLARQTMWKPGRLSGNKEIKKLRYRNRYQLDIAQATVSNDQFWGTTGGAVFAFSDLLGNDQYYFMIYNNARTRSEILQSFNLALTKVSLRKRTNYAYGFFRLSGQYFNFKDNIFFEQRTGGFFTLSYPFSQFKRIEFSTSLIYSDKEFLGDLRRIAWLTSNSISLVHDNSLWSYTGPVEGSRYKISIGNTYDFRWSRVNYWTFLLDYRHYFRIAPSVTYAVRFLSLLNDGKETRWFYLGGSWDMRGYSRFAIRGEKILFMSHEIRFPFLKYMALQFPFGLMGFRSIRGALFVDAGNGWIKRWPGLIGSYGFGFRLNMWGFLVLRLDFGKRTDFKSYSSDWFTQFFFGWDF